FGGARRVCQTLINSTVYPTGQAETIGRLAAGFQALDDGADDRARRCFEEVCDPAETPQFFLHWYWRVHARVGATRACLHTGDTARGRLEAGQLLRAAISTDDRNLHALAWDTTARVAIAEMKWSDAEQAIENAFRAIAGSDVPT